MYPSNLQTNLRRREGAYVQTSLSRAFPHDGQIVLSPVARSTFPRKYRAASYGLRATSKQKLSLLEARGSKLEADGIRASGSSAKTGPVAQLARAHP